MPENVTAVVDAGVDIEQGTVALEVVQVQSGAAVKAVPKVIALTPATKAEVPDSIAFGVEPCTRAGSHRGAVPPASDTIDPNGSMATFGILALSAARVTELGVPVNEKSVPAPENVVDVEPSVRRAPRFRAAMCELDVIVLVPVEPAFSSMLI